jgi:hypothetical protein
VTYDVVAVVPTMPDVRAILAGMIAAGEDLLVDETAEGGIIRLSDDAGNPIVSIEVPLLIQVAGEVERLLGIREDTVPVWWVEARATARDGADGIARDFAAELVRRLGGSVWTSDAVPPEAS